MQIGARSGGVSCSKRQAGEHQPRTSPGERTAWQMQTNKSRWILVEGRTNCLRHDHCRHDADLQHASRGRAQLVCPAEHNKGCFCSVWTRPNSPSGTSRRADRRCSQLCPSSLAACGSCSLLRGGAVRALVSCHLHD